MSQQDDIQQDSTWTSPQDDGYVAPDITEQEVDDRVYNLILKHREDVVFDEKEFLDLLKFSLSLNVDEKRRVVDAMPTLSQFQINELKKVFTDERVKFRELAWKHPEDIKKLVLKQQREWLIIWDLYRSDEEKASVEEWEKEEIDNIKKNLGL